MTGGLEFLNQTFLKCFSFLIISMNYMFNVIRGLSPWANCVILLCGFTTVSGLEEVLENSNQCSISSVSSERTVLEAALPSYMQWWSRPGRFPSWRRRCPAAFPEPRTSGVTASCCLFPKTQKRTHSVSHLHI